MTGIETSNSGGETEAKVTKEVGQDQAKMAVDGASASEPLCEGDTTVIYNVLTVELEAGAFEKMRDEVDWQRMSHQGGEVPRLVAVQGEVAVDGSMPVYRHPSDESPPLKPFSPTVRKLKEEVEKHLGHPLNHVLIQFYRDGKDYISEHSDKTLDIVRGTYIANLSLGAERTMVFRTKRVDKDFTRKDPSPQQSESSSPVPRQIQKAKLPHNSLCRMGLQTNMRWLHAIKQDKRLDAEKTAAELAFGGARISLTFRHIGTFLNAEQTLIWGQGATGKTRDEARPVVNNDNGLTGEVVRAFGTENHASEFDWEACYGRGFDVLHMSHRR
jgi:alkylated DNA repair dioxygenase AlkB